MSVPPPTVSAAPPIQTAACEACGQALDVRATICTRCGFPQGGPALVAGRALGAKKPRTAMWLSLSWPGAGHFYAGDSEKGIIFSALALVCCLLSATIAGPVLGLLIWLGLALHTAIDSSRAVAGA